MTVNQPLPGRASEGYGLTAVIAGDIVLTLRHGKQPAGNYLKGDKRWLGKISQKACSARTGFLT